MEFITPNDKEIKGYTDSERIQNAINLAIERNINVVIIPEFNMCGDDVWIIDQAILLPSNITIYLDNAHLLTPKDAYCNFFRNSNFYEDIGKTKDGEQTNIKIIGIGEALLDGGEYNELSESNGLKDGRPSIKNNCMILMNNVKNVEIKNLKTRHHRWWAFCFSYSNNVHISDISFWSDYAYRNEKGERCTDRTAVKEYECYVKNGDGIDLRNGCHDFLIENISGRTEDDSVALTTLQGSWHDFFVEGQDDDIHDVTIRHLHTDCLDCGNIRLTCADGNQIYNVTMDDIVDTSPIDAPYHSMGTIKINDSYYHYTRISKLGEMRNIKISNVHSRSFSAVRLEQTAQNIILENVIQHYPEGHILAHFKGYGYLWENNGPFDYENIDIINCRYECEKKTEALKFEKCNLKNINIKDCEKDFYLLADNK